MHVRNVSGPGWTLPGRSAGQVLFTKSTTTRANSGPLSSCRKWPPLAMVTWCWPAAPGIRLCRTRSEPAADRITVAERGEERLFDGEDLPGGAVGLRAGSSGEMGTRVGNWRRPRCRSDRGTVRRTGDDVRAEIGCAAAVDDGAGGEGVHLLGELEPPEEGPLGVPSPVGRTCSPPQPDRIDRRVRPPVGGRSDHPSPGRPGSPRTDRVRQRGGSASTRHGGQRCTRRGASVCPNDRTRPDRAPPPAGRLPSAAEPCDGRGSTTTARRGAGRRTVRTGPSSR